MPDVDHIRTHSDVINAFMKSVYGEDVSPDKTGTGKKRRLSQEDIRTAVARIDWMRLAERDDLGNLTVEDLKKYLEFHNLRLSGKKADLIDRIKAHLAD